MITNSDNKYYYILARGSETEVKQLLFNMPDNPIKDSAIMLLANPTPISVVLSFGSLLVSYSYGANCKTGAELSFAVYQYAKDLKQSGKYSELLTMTILGYAGNYITALNNLGRFNEVIDFIDSEMAVWDIWKNKPTSSQDLKGINENIKSMLVAKIFAFVELKEIDKAEAVINDTSHPVEGNWASDIELKRLKGKIERIKTSPTTITDDKQEKIGHGKTNHLQQEDMFDTLRKMMSELNLGDLPEDLLNKAQSFDPMTKQGMKQTEDFLTRGEEFLNKNSGEINEITVRQKVRRASQIFVDNKPSVNDIQNSRKILNKSLEESQYLDNYTLENDARYGLYLCNSRLNNYSEAADQLIAIRKNLEGIRLKIENPYKKAGVFKIYPYLFDASVEYLCKSKRFEDMLDAIEGDKGRLIYDVLGSKTTPGIDEFIGWDISSKLLPYLKKENAHYLSFHLDEDSGYYIILLNSGKITGNTLPFGKNQLKIWTEGYNLHDPAKWTENITPINIIENLNPLVSFLEMFIDNNYIKEGEHICYSPDQLLYLFPLSYLKIKNKRLIEYFTISRVHNAMHLINLLDMKIELPKNSFVLSVPCQTDPDSIKQKFKEIPEFLNTQKFSEIALLKNEEADYEGFSKAILKKTLIHFSTHGVFSPNSPFDDSGLLISKSNKLPPKDQLPIDRKHILSPRKLIELSTEKYLANAHISMHACVSGNAREGIAGDALGLEWAFLQKGAISLSSTYWNVNIKAANEYFKLFYTKWIIEGLSKAKAHQITLIKLKNKEWEKWYPEEYFWAAFELIGDWR